MPVGFGTLKKKIAVPVILFGMIAAFGAVWYTRTVKGKPSFSGSSKVIFLRTDMTPDEAFPLLRQDSVLSPESGFLSLCRLKSVDSLKKGRYEIKKNESLNGIVNRLRAGLQTPVNVSVDGVRDIYRLCGILGKQLLADSSEFMAVLLSDSLLKKQGLRKEEAISLIFPNTYEMYWTVSPEAFVKKMTAVHEKYWDEENRGRAAALGLTPAEVTTLASIVKGETVNKSEAPKIAGLYLNRLRIGQALQADPTLVFAQSLKGVDRIYHSDTKVDSPYNTYRNSGLPPGPIFMTEPVYLDAVLRAEKHSYLYMCAQPNGTGLHNFTQSYSEHVQNAAKYHRWLDSRGIR